jgi:hypothetical protein
MERPDERIGDSPLGGQGQRGDDRAVLFCHDGGPRERGRAVQCGQAPEGGLVGGHCCSQEDAAEAGLCSWNRHVSTVP